MVIGITNLKQSIDKFKNIENIDLMPVIRLATRRVQRKAKTDFVPVDTGYLKGSILTKMHPKQQTGVVFTTTEYAPYQEFGTSKMKGQPFMRPALLSEQEQTNKDMEEHIKNELKKQAK